LDAESLEQVAEFVDQPGTKDYGNQLVALATEYNDALLIVERENIGWAVLQQIVDRKYQNTFYCSADLKYIEVERQLRNKYYSEEKKLLPGFSTTITTRPLVISKLEAYFREKAIKIHSIRTISELRTFIWKNGKAQAADNYNDDLVMALGLGLWVRDTALKLRQEGIYLTKKMLDTINVPKASDSSPIYTSKAATTAQQYWQMKTGLGPNEIEKLDWLL